MISKSLSTSEKFAALHHEAGKLAEFCQSLYPLIVAHADDWGCLQGDVFTVKHLVLPTSPRKLVEFEAALKALHNVGLITWYQAAEDDPERGKWFVHVRGWFAHQQLKGHESRKRNFPQPPETISTFDVSAQIRPLPPKSALRELNRTKENLTYTVADATAEVFTPETGSDPLSGSDVYAFLKTFCELYSKHRHGAKYAVIRAKDVPTVRRLLAVYGADRLEKIATMLLTTNEPWIEDTDRGVGILSVKASWCDGRLADYEAEHGQKAAS